ncbi:hypothetical protein AB0912_20435 [Streptomyces sp. NPDC007084]|uniref:SbtR family transcriptional regulator n=1 Tax=Streptomyces sp. NPDC007084 TaxID=3154313 RepID=UPI003452A4BB
MHTAADERVGVLCPVVQSTYETHGPETAASRAWCERLIGTVMDRAKAVGVLRPDVDADTVMIATAKLSRPPVGIECGVADRFIHDHLQIFLDGLRVLAGSDPSSYR